MTEPESCTHYKRNCKLVAPCCNKIFSCRVCHDDSEDHTLDRKKVTEIVCCKCDKKSEIRNTCDECSVVFGEAYYCQICRLFDNVDKGQFHCDGCGICRVGGSDKFEHCFTCGMCMPKNTSHKCIEQSAQNNCPVCFESIHSSRSETYIPPCGHLIHMPCYKGMLKSGLYSCPSCGKALQDMRSAWRLLDREVLETPMPREYADLYREVLCKDCGKTSNALFHVVGMKCANEGCGSYNTSLEGPFLRKSESGTFTPLSDNELEHLYTVALPGMSISNRMVLGVVRAVTQLTDVLKGVLNIWSSLLNSLSWFNPLAYIPSRGLERDSGAENPETEAGDDPEHSDDWEDVEGEDSGDENEELEGQDSEDLPDEIPEPPLD